MTTPFAELVAASLTRARFTLVDVGCAGGVESVWRVFGERFRAIGFDASVSECQRLTQTEVHPGVRYVAGFVDLTADHPFALRNRGKPDVADDPHGRLSSAWAMELRRAKLKTARASELREHNAWELTQLADPALTISVPDFLRSENYHDVDLLKIDIDGSDFRVLNSFDGLFDGLGILALRLEVNFHGGAEDHLHTFHNTDRLMRKAGFALFALDERRYSARALPAKFITTSPAETVTGRLYQGDAFYARDLASASYRGLASSLGAEKIAKMAAIFSVWKQPDGAAELLLAYRSLLTSLFDVDQALDLLAVQTQPDMVDRPLDYRQYMARFAADSPEFYLPTWLPPPRPSLRRRIRTALRAFNDPFGAFAAEEWPRSAGR